MERSLVSSAGLVLVFPRTGAAIAHKEQAAGKFSLLGVSCPPKIRKWSGRMTGSPRLILRYPKEAYGRSGSLPSEIFGIAVHKLWFKRQVHPTPIPLDIKNGIDNRCPTGASRLKVRSEYRRQSRFTSLRRQNRAYLL